MATMDELRQVVREVVRAETADAVWDVTVPDYYPTMPAGQAPPNMPIWAAIAWGTRHAAKGYDHAAAALDEIRRVGSAVAALPDQIAATVVAAAGPGGHVDAEAVRVAVTQALGSLGPFFLTTAQQPTPSPDPSR